MRNNNITIRFKTLQAKGQIVRINGQKILQMPLIIRMERPGCSTRSNLAAMIANQMIWLKCDQWDLHMRDVVLIQLINMRSVSLGLRSADEIADSTAQ